MGAYFKAIKRSASLFILLAAVSVFIVASCHTERLTAPLHFSKQNSCQEHTLSTFKGDIKFIDDAILPSVNVLLAIFVVGFLYFFARNDTGLRAIFSEICKRNGRLRWVWAKATPFVSAGYSPYFAAQRDP